MRQVDFVLVKVLFSPVRPQVFWPQAHRERARWDRQHRHAE